MALFASTAGALFHPLLQPRTPHRRHPVQPHALADLERCFAQWESEFSDNPPDERETYEFQCQVRRDRGARARGLTREHSARPAPLFTHLSPPFALRSARKCCSPITRRPRTSSFSLTLSRLPRSLGFTRGSAGGSPSERKGGPAFSCNIGRTRPPARRRRRSKIWACCRLNRPSCRRESSGRPLTSPEPPPSWRLWPNSKRRSLARAVWVYPEPKPKARPADRSGEHYSIYICTHTHVSYI